ncbi:MAG: purine catabolism regulator [Cellvibrionaceae bacterium]|jgi:purine catabolism regulator
MDQGQVTLSDVQKLALPMNTITTGSADHQSRVINWVVVLTDWIGIREQVQLGDLVIIPLNLQLNATTSELLSGLQTMGALAVAGIVVFQQVDSVIQIESGNIELPLLIITDDLPMRDVLKAVSSLLLDRQATLSERGMQLYRQLSEMSREEQGLQAMTDLMSRVTSKIVVVQDKRLEIQAISVPENNKIDLDQLKAALQKREDLPPVLRNRKAAARTRQSHWQQLLPVENIGRLLTPIISGDRARGYLSTIGPADELDMLDKLTTEHGAAACALEMAKAKAVSEAKKELRGDFLEGILAGTVDRSEIERLKMRLDHDTDQPHAVLTFSWNNEQENSVRHLETAINWVLSSHNRPALVHIYGGAIVTLFQGMRNNDDLGSVRELERRLREYLELENRDVVLLSGLAGPAESLSDWSLIYQHAVQAMKLSQRLGIKKLVEYDSLGVYQLLTQLDDNPTVHEFSSRIIGPLSEYDERHRSNLVNTIAAYFEHHGNISQTAESLFIHRNTLLYRLERIRDLTSHDLNQADMRLALHLALKLWQLRVDK